MTIADHLPRTVDDVRIRALTYADAAAFADGTADEAVKRFAHLPLPHYTEQIVRDQIDGVIADGLADGSLAVLALADAATDRFLGGIVLYDVRGDRAEVGFWLAPDARGRGAARQGLHAAAALAAAAGLRVLDARTFPDNAASRRALEAAGFGTDGIAHTEQTPSGATAEVLRYERELRVAS